MIWGRWLERRCWVYSQHYSWASCCLSSGLVEFRYLIWKAKSKITFNQNHFMLFICIQDSELCLSLSLALLFMKLASLCWICCCCHHSLIIFRKNTNISLQPEQKMGKVFAHYRWERKNKFFLFEAFLFSLLKRMSCLEDGGLVLIELWLVHERVMKIDNLIMVLRCNMCSWLVSRSS